MQQADRDRAAEQAMGTAAALKSRARRAARQSDRAAEQVSEYFSSGDSVERLGSLLDRADRLATIADNLEQAAAEAAEAAERLLAVRYQLPLFTADGLPHREQVTA